VIKIIATDFDGQSHQIQANTGATLMEALREYEWGVAAICGGLCACGTCHVYLDEAWLNQFPQADPDERDLLDVFDSCQANSRLSCQLRLQDCHDGLHLTIAPDE